MNKSAQIISICVCVISTFIYVADTDFGVTATVFGAVIAGLTATAQVGQLLGALAGDAVAIKVGNHFRYVTLVRAAESPYIYDGEEYVIQSMAVDPGDEDSGGGFDDGWWNAGGVAGSVRYSMDDPDGYKYCMDILYANDQADFGGYDAWAVAVGSDLCNLKMSDVFHEWKDYRGFFSSQSMGAGYAFGGNTWTSYGTAGNSGYSTTSNSDGKISWKVDMDDNGVGTLTVEVGPYEWWSSGDTFAGHVADEVVDIVRSDHDNIIDNKDTINIADILLIFSFFVIGLLSLGIGIFFGAKWTAKKAESEKMQESELNTI